MTLPGTTWRTRWATCRSVRFSTRLPPVTHLPPVTRISGGSVCVAGGGGRGEDTMCNVGIMPTPTIIVFCARRAGGVAGSLSRSRLCYAGTAFLYPPKKQQQKQALPHRRPRRTGWLTRLYFPAAALAPSQTTRPAAKPTPATSACSPPKMARSVKFSS